MPRRVWLHGQEAFCTLSSLPCLAQHALPACNRKSRSRPQRFILPASTKEGGSYDTRSQMQRSLFVWGARLELIDGEGCETPDSVGSGLMSKTGGRIVIVSVP